MAAEASLSSGRSEPVADRQLGRGRAAGVRRHPLHAWRPRLAARSSALSRCCRCMAVWWRDVIREATFQGMHTPVVQLGLRYGMALFIASEVMFFSAFFWAFFSSSLFPVGGVWPPKGIHPFDPFEPPVSQHADPAAVGHHGDLGAPFADRRQPEGADPGSDADRAARDQLHLPAGLRIRARRVQLPLRPASRRRHLSLDLLHGDRVSRLPCDRRHDLSRGVPVARRPGAISSRTIISASRRRPGTGISSMSSGCSCSSASTGGAWAPRSRPSIERRRRRRAATRERRGGPVRAGLGAARRPGLPLPALRRGALFAGLLTVRPACPVCGLDLSAQDAGDGPAVFVIFFSA